MDALERRGFWYEVDLRFGAIDTLMLTREREGGGGKKETLRKVPNSSNIHKYIECKKHEHVTCKVKSIIGSTQSKPTRT